VLEPLRGDEPFKVPVTRESPVVDRVKNLEGVTGLDPGTGWEPGDLTGVRLPLGHELDREPRPIARPSPRYPADMRQAGLEGSVTVEFVVGTDGRVVTAEAVRWTRREFVDEAVGAVRTWRFEPGTINGRKVRFRMAVPIEFMAED